MFADLVGSTALSTRLDPEEMREVLRAYQNTVTVEIVRVGGHVAKLMGDGVLAYFGWPHAHEDDAERAVEAGLAAVAAVGHLKTPDGEVLSARVGVATGLVVVGDLIGEGAAQEEAVIGETPNLAARLQAAAEPGSVVIASGTRRLLRGLFELRELGTAAIKGFSEPVSRFQVVREHPTSSRFETQSSGQAMPMVGRDQEFALALERWQPGSCRRRSGRPAGRRGRDRQVTAGPGFARDGRRGRKDHAEISMLAPHAGTRTLAGGPAVRRCRRFRMADTEVGRSKSSRGCWLETIEDVAVATPLIAMLLGIQSGDGHLVQSLSPHQQRARHPLHFSRTDCRVRPQETGTDGHRRCSLGRPYYS